MRDAAQVMRMYGNDEAIRIRVAALMDELYDYHPVRVATARARPQDPFGERTSSIFSASIGPEPEPSVIGATATALDPNQTGRLKLADGPVQTLANELRQILRLKWHDGQLVLDRQHCAATSQI